MNPVRHTILSDARKTNIVQNGAQFVNTVGKTNESERRRKIRR